VANHIYEDVKHVGFVEDGFAVDHHGHRRYRVEHNTLIDLETGQVVGRLNAVLGTVSRSGLFD
jgi:hypothetical protein